MSGLIREAEEKAAPTPHLLMPEHHCCLVTIEGGLLCNSSNGLTTRGLNKKPGFRGGKEDAENQIKWKDSQHLGQLAVVESLVLELRLQGP